MCIFKLNQPSREKQISRIPYITLQKLCLMYSILNEILTEITMVTKQIRQDSSVGCFCNTAPGV